MPQLRGSDAGWLYMESRDQPMTVPFLLVVRPRTDGRPGRALTVDDLRVQVLGHLDDLPALRWRLVVPPLGLQRPSFDVDPNFDLAYHVRSAALPSPGSREDLDRFVVAATTRRMDRRHPLWQLILINGLADGAQAVLLRTHHALIDGTALRNLTSRLFADLGEASEDASAVASAVGPPAPQPLPIRQIRRDARADQRHAFRRLPALLKDTKRRLDLAKAEEESSPVKVPAMNVDTPPIRWNRGYSAERVAAHTTLALSDVQELRRLAGVSTTAVVLAVVAEAARSYLLVHDELPDQPLTANVPLSAEAVESDRHWGNYFCNYVTTLATDELDPWTRMQLIETVSNESRRRLDVLGRDTIVRWLDYIPPALGQPGARWVARSKRAHPEKASFNMLVSNVRGHPDPMAFGPVQVDEVLVWGPPTEGEGVNVTLWSYRDQLGVTVQADAAVLDDPGELARGIAVSLDSLLALARTRAGAQVVG